MLRLDVALSDRHTYQEHDIMADRNKHDFGFLLDARREDVHRS